jgi:hypothetical protein
VHGLLLGLGAAGVAAIAAGVVRFPSLLPWGLALLGAEYACALAVAGRGVDGRAPLVAAGLVLAAELAYWSLEARTRVAEEPQLARRRLALILVVAAGSAAAAAAVVAAASLPYGGGLAWDALGVAAATAALATVAVLARRA